ncbi:antitoxin VapB [Kytococcus aerolatus]|uniref:Antitoxin VapB n=1 Tax=Kytococcus aerolatus TaxID=592308 RepID=A0A212TBN7_9MICO|nr:type II toxin-antitoxin system VapB family antitoxin [Kytococcus aerolatus]SNC63467.1 antitoxin VapB [Kytococcus aerolatus]
MALNIKNERVHQLARQAAELQGTTQTGALERALEEFLERHGAEADAGAGERGDRLARATLLVEQIRCGIEQGEGSLAEGLVELYDADGLPR